MISSTSTSTSTRNTATTDSAEGSARDGFLPGIVDRRRRAAPAPPAPPGLARVDAIDQPRKNGSGIRRDETIEENIGRRRCFPRRLVEVRDDLLGRGQERTVARHPHRDFFAALVFVDSGVSKKVQGQRRPFHAPGDLAKVDALDEQRVVRSAAERIFVDELAVPVLDGPVPLFGFRISLVPGIDDGLVEFSPLVFGPRGPDVAKPDDCVGKPREFRPRDVVGVGHVFGRKMDLVAVQFFEELLGPRHPEPRLFASDRRVVFLVRGQILRVQIPGARHADQKLADRPQRSARDQRIRSDLGRPVSQDLGKKVRLVRDEEEHPSRGSPGRGDRRCALDARRGQAGRGEAGHGGGREGDGHGFLQINGSFRASSSETQRHPCIVPNLDCF